MDEVTPTGPELAVSDDVVWLRVEDPSASGTVRRRAAEVAERIGFDERAVGEISIVATELATNLAKYAHDGSVLVRVLRAGHATGLTIVALDHGPGMKDMQALFVDGESTSGTLGIGLGAVRRLADSYDAHSVPGHGTVVTATFWREEAADEPAAGLARSLEGEDECGDAYAVRRTERGLLLMLADGLGHGTLAAHASTECVRCFRDSSEEAPAALLREIHGAVSATRGAAVAIANVDPGAARLTYAGVGNIAGRLVLERQKRGLVSTPGIVGHNLRRVQDTTYDLVPGAWLVMHSDGLSDKWDLAAYPGLLSRSPLVVATTLLRDAAVRRDDASVLVWPVGQR